MTFVYQHVDIFYIGNYNTNEEFAKSSLFLYTFGCTTPDADTGTFFTTRLNRRKRGLVRRRGQIYLYRIYAQMLVTMHMYLSVCTDHVCQYAQILVNLDGTMDYRTWGEVQCEHFTCCGHRCCRPMYLVCSHRAFETRPGQRRPFWSNLNRSHGNRKSVGTISSMCPIMGVMFLSIIRFVL